MWMQSETLWRENMKSYMWLGVLPALVVTGSMAVTRHVAAQEPNGPDVTHAARQLSSWPTQPGAFRSRQQLSTQTALLLAASGACRLYLSVEEHIRSSLMRMCKQTMDLAGGFRLTL
jgi:hypothetical protein